MLNKNWLKILPLILLAIAIALSPSFSAGNLPKGKIIEIRVEDFLILILGFIWLASLLVSRKKKVKKPPLFFPILVWLSFGFLATLTNLIFGNLEIWRGFFYFLKEIEFFFFYFYFFYHIKSINSAKLLIKVWIFLGVLNVGYVLYQIVTGFLTGEYGTGAICEWGVFPTGAFFLILFIFLLNIFLYYFLNLDISRFKKGFLGIVAISPIIGVFGSCSKTDFLAVLFALFLTIIFFFLRNKSFKSILTIFLILIFIVGIFIFIVKTVPRAHRLPNVFIFKKLLGNFERERVGTINDVFENALSQKTPLSGVFGLGKGYVREAHNQYVRNLIETGIIGTIAFLVLIFVIVKKSIYGFLKSKNRLSIGLSAGLLVATLAMLFCSFATEPFIVVKVSEVYWVFTAITMAVLVINKKEDYVK